MTSCFGSSSPDQESPAFEPFQPAPWYTLSGMFPDQEVVQPKQHLHPDAQLEIDRLIERGKYLAISVAACGSCHAANPADPDSPLSGGRLVLDNEGEVHAPNITPDDKTGIGTWTVPDVMRAVRASIGKEDRALSIEAHGNYRWMTDRDARAIAAYLLSQPPVSSLIKRRDIGLFGRKRMGLINRRRPVQGYVPALPDTQATPEYGRYLSENVAGCKNCHTSRDGLIYDGEPFAGSKPLRGKSFIKDMGDLLWTGSQVVSTAGKQALSQTEAGAQNELLSDEAQTAGGNARQPANTTPPKPAEPQGRGATTPPLQLPPGAPDIRASAGLQGWQIDDIVSYLNSGNTRQGASVNPAACPWGYYRQMNEKDKRAIARYLKSL